MYYNETLFRADKPNTSLGGACLRVDYTGKKKKNRVAPNVNDEHFLYALTVSRECVKRTGLKRDTGTIQISLK